MPPVIEMSYFFSIEVRHSRQVAPLCKAHFLQQPETRLVALQDDCKEMMDPERRASRQRVLDQRCPDSLTMIGISNVITDLSREAQRRTTGSVRAQAAPACHVPVRVRDKDGMLVSAMFVEPRDPVFDA